MKRALAAFLLFFGSIGTAAITHATTYTINFDALASGSDAATIATPFGNVHLTTNATHFDADLNPVPSSLIVSSGFMTTSGSNYLGAAGGLSLVEQQFSPGHTVTLDFSGLSTEVIGISAHFVTNFNRFPLEDPFVEYPPGLFSIAAAATTAGSTVPGAIYDDLGKDFFVGLLLGTPFTTAQLVSSDSTGQTDAEGVFSPDLYSFTIDNITITTTGTAVVPEPSTLLLVALGGIGLVITRRQRKTGN